VAASDHAYQNTVDNLRLTDNDFADFFPDLVEMLNRLAECAVCEHSIILWQRDDSREPFPAKFEKKRKEAGDRHR
jgi:hypothetical protein